MRNRYLPPLVIFLTSIIWINLLSCKAQLPIGETSVPGIDKPVLIKNVSMTCPVVGNQTNDLELTLKDAYSSEKLLAKDGERFPQVNYIFFTLVTDINVLGNCMDLRAIGKQLRLDCGDGDLEPVFSGVNVDLGDDSGRKGFSYSFEIPINTLEDTCFLSLLDGQTIPITPVISD